MEKLMYLLLSGTYAWAAVTAHREQHIEHALHCTVVSACYLTMAIEGIAPDFSP